MMSASLGRSPWWTWLCPFLSLLVLTVHFVLHPGLPSVPFETLALVATVFAAVYHAEVVAHWVGEPLGTLVLSLAVTVIVSIMIIRPEGSAVLARDTVFAAVMIVCTGIVGICLLTGGLRHREQCFQLQGANASLSVLIALTTLTLILPNVTITTPGPVFSSS